MSVNVPVTVYRNTNGLTEFTNEGINDIVDSSANNLVDTDGNDIVDTGVVATLIPPTTYEENDGL